MDSLAVWSGVALAIRVAGLITFIYVGRIQFNQFQYKTNLQPLKRLLFYFIVAIVVSNVPILLLNYSRAQGYSIGGDLTDFATVSNALGMLFAAGLLLAVYRYKGND